MYVQYVERELVYFMYIMVKNLFWVVITPDAGLEPATTGFTFYIKVLRSAN